MLKSKGAQVIINARNNDRLEAAAKQHGLFTVQSPKKMMSKKYIISSSRNSPNWMR
jgi:NADP-dependent 3-hydroxy acid dehydrogenase YdfG